MHLARFALRNRNRFAAELDCCTNELCAVLPRSDQYWGLARRYSTFSFAIAFTPATWRNHIIFTGLSDGLRCRSIPSLRSSCGALQVAVFCLLGWEFDA